MNETKEPITPLAVRSNVGLAAEKKCCHKCRNLEWVEGEMTDPAGWTCNKRQYHTTAAELKHLSQLDSEKYRMKSKKCFDAANNRNEGLPKAVPLD